MPGLCWREKRLLKHFPHPMRRFPIQCHHALLLLVFEIIQPQRIGPASQQINSPRGLTDFAPRTHPRINQGWLPLTVTVITLIGIPIPKIGVQIQPRSVWRANTELMPARVLRQQRSRPGNRKLLRLDPRRRRTLTEIKLQPPIHLLQALIHLLVHPIRREIFPRQSHRLSPRILLVKTPQQIRHRLHKLPVRQSRQIPLRRMQPRPCFGGVKRLKDILRHTLSVWPHA